MASILDIALSEHNGEVCYGEGGLINESLNAWRPKNKCNMINLYDAHGKKSCIPKYNLGRERQHIRISHVTGCSKV